MRTIIALGLGFWLAKKVHEKTQKEKLMEEKKKLVRKATRLLKKHGVEQSEIDKAIKTILK